MPESEEDRRDYERAIDILEDARDVAVPWEVARRELGLDSDDKEPPLSIPSSCACGAQFDEWDGLAWTEQVVVKRLARRRPDGRVEVGEDERILTSAGAEELYCQGCGRTVLEADTAGWNATVVFGENG